MTQPERLDRATLEAQLQRYKVALEARDVATLSAGLHPEIRFVWPGLQLQGRAQVQTTLQRYLANRKAVRLYLRQLLIDDSYAMAAVEWVYRYADSEESAAQEVLGGVVLQFDEQGLITYGRVYLDPVRSRKISGLNEPWPEAGWSPSQNPGPPPGRAFIEQLIKANARAWASHEVGQLRPIMHDEICLCPPWDYRLGRQSAERGAQVYFDHYRDTHVTPHRFIIDSTQPYFGVCEQTFACTNPETGQRGADHDFAFFEIAQGKLRYWRTYFDTGKSVQVIEKTAGFLEQRQDG
jgi:hypothetical protein